MNFKRKRSKRSPKCTLCTKYSWLGNKLERHNRNTQKKKINAESDIASFLCGNE